MAMACSGPPRSLHASGSPTTEDLSARLSLIHDELRTELTHERRCHPAIQSISSACSRVQGRHRVWLLRHNNKMTRPSDKLDYRELGLFKIIATGGPISFQLELPPSFTRLHPVFHVSLPEPYHSPADIPDPTEPPPPPVFIDGDPAPWPKVDKIIDCCKITQCYDYLVPWKGLTPDKNSWVPLLDMSIGLNEPLEQFHRHTTNR
ncbi:hypothetical protein RSAG8_05747, partial [Rhizoctonia solani AG-8 WAC10335]